MLAREVHRLRLQAVRFIVQARQLFRHAGMNITVRQVLDPKEERKCV